MQLRKNALTLAKEMSIWPLISLMFNITFLVTESSKFKSPKLLQPFHKDDGLLFFTDNKVFWAICSRYFMSDHVILVVTSQRRKYAVDDFSSVLLQQMHKHLTTPITTMEYSKRILKLNCIKFSEIQQLLNNKFTRDFNVRLQCRPDSRSSKHGCVQNVRKSRKHEPEVIYSPYRKKLESISGEYKYHKTTRLKRTTEHISIQKKYFRYVHKNRHIVKTRSYSVPHKVNVQVRPRPSVACSNRSKHFNVNCRTVFPATTHPDRMRSLHFSCENYLIVADDETSIIRYFIYVTKINVTWNSKIRFLILLHMQFGYNSTDEFKGRCKSLLQNLWERFKVMNVIIMTSSVIQCRYQISQEVILYNPFFPKRGSTERGSVIILNGTKSELLMKISVPTSELQKFHGYPLRVTMFRRVPTVVPRMECRANDKHNCTVTYTGMDALLLHSLATYLNFTLLIRQPSDGLEYGYETINGTFTGTLGDVVYGRTDISMNGVFIKVYGSDKIQFTHNAYSDEVCIIVPKAKRMPKWFTVFGATDSAVALSVLGIYITNACFYFIIRQIHGWFEPKSLESNFGWPTIITDMFRPFVFSPFTRIPMVSSQRIFLGSCLVFGVVLTTSMQGMLVTAMTKPYYYPDINTLEELDSSGLTIYTNSPSIIDTFGTSHINPTMDSLSRKVQTAVNTTDLWDVVAKERNCTAMVRKSDYQYGVPLSRYRASDGSFLLHVVRECPRRYLLGYLMPTGSPYLPYINEGIARLVEAGIVEHWKQTTTLEADVHSTLHGTNLRKTAAMNKEDPKVFSLKDLQLAFYMLTVGLSASVIIFSFEMIFRKMAK